MACPVSVNLNQIDSSCCHDTTVSLDGYSHCLKRDPANLTGEAFGFEGLGQTYLSLDVDGRVVRLDSFSKFLAPGMRLGWVTAHPDMLQKICFALHASTMGPCSFTQVQHLLLSVVMNASIAPMLTRHNMLMLLLECHDLDVYWECFNQQCQTVSEQSPPTL